MALTEVFPTSRTHHEAKRSEEDSRWRKNLGENLQGSNLLMPVMCPEPKAKVQRGCEAKFFCIKGQEKSTKCNKFLSF